MAEKGLAKPRASRANAGKAATPPTPRRVRAKLGTIGDVTKELARLYREARGGTLDTADASKLANILALMGRLIEGSDLERRVEEIEKQRSKEQGSWVPSRRH
jgi:hypothetical protein